MPFFIGLCLNSASTLGQVHEIGVNVGALNYTGDLSAYYDPFEYRLAGQAFYRHNASKATSYRLGVIYGNLAGSDATPFDNLAQNRNYAFDRNLLEVDALVEYHFLDYKDPNSLIRWSPYFFGGVGLTYLFGTTTAPDGTAYQPFQPVIPVGMGFKWQVAPRLSINIDLGGRITFTDYLDDISGVPTDTDAKNFLFGQWNTRDTYYYTGFSLCYTFYTIQCPYDTY